MLYVNPIAQHRTAATERAAEDPARRREALQELEHYFLYTMLREMERMAPPDRLIGGSAAENTFRDMLHDALAGEMAQSGQFGIADQIARQLDQPPGPPRAATPLPPHTTALSSPARDLPINAIGIQSTALAQPPRRMP